MSDTDVHPSATEGLASAEHEQVSVFHDPTTGLRAVVAIHSTALGPALGGTRWRDYPSLDHAVGDVLRLSRAMTAKNALAGLDHGGGKAVIWGDPNRDRSEALLRSYGRFVQSLGGRYVTACDVGTTVADMDVVARDCDHVTGRSVAEGGSGDSGVMTAFGVYQGMRAAAMHRWGDPSLRGRTIGVTGIGKVGANLVPLLLAEQAVVVVADVHAPALAAVVAAHPGVIVAAGPEDLLTRDLDIWAPCALGGAVDAAVASTLRAQIVCGGANNQLTSPDLAGVLAERDVLLCPDFCVNAGGVIQVADERHGPSPDRVRQRTARIYDTTLEVLRLAAEHDETPTAAADRLAARRVEQVGTTRIWQPTGS